MYNVFSRFWFYFVFDEFQQFSIGALAQNLNSVYLLIGRMNSK